LIKENEMSDTGTPKKLIKVLRGAPGHWVGDGFPVRSLFSYPQYGQVLSPFLLLDYGGPTDFSPTDTRRGVGEHPHRGFETVTIVYHGEVEHRDSSGGGGIIGPGDVQWMTAGGGIVHDEFHGREYAAKGGPFQMVQLWVNLPAKDKMTKPKYQAITNADIPKVEVRGGFVRVIAGEFDGAKGPASTFTPMEVWDVKLEAGHELALPIADGFNTGLVVLEGAARVGDETVADAEVAVFEREGGAIALRAEKDTRALLLAGEPIEEPIVGRGPFVMNTPEEIYQAIEDYQHGRMGKLD
jgi:quercetin 2,3-dioxygenase